MKYKLTTSANYYTKKDANILKSLGFKFDFNTCDLILSYTKIYTKVEIEINSIKDFKELQKKVISDLIIDFVEKRIEIYDGYRE